MTAGSVGSEYHVEQLLFMEYTPLGFGSYKECLTSLRLDPEPLLIGESITWLQLKWIPNSLQRLEIVFVFRLLQDKGLLWLILLKRLVEDCPECSDGVYVISARVI